MNAREEGGGRFQQQKENKFKNQDGKGYGVWNNKQARTVLIANPGILFKEKGERI